jgi:hypothetical protein
MHAYGRYAETKCMPYYALVIAVIKLLYVKASLSLSLSLSHALKSSSQDHYLIV